MCPLPLPSPLLQKTRLKRWGLPQNSALEGWAVYGLLGRPVLRCAAPAAAMHAVLNALKAALFAMEGAYKPVRPAAPSPPADGPPVLEEAEEEEEQEDGGRGGIAAATAAMALGALHSSLRIGLVQAAGALLPREPQVRLPAAVAGSSRRGMHCLHFRAPYPTSAMRLAFASEPPPPITRVHASSMPQLQVGEAAAQLRDFILPRVFSTVYSGLRGNHPETSIGCLRACVHLIPVEGEEEEEEE